jgi:hypothetical protein
VGTDFINHLVIRKRLSLWVCILQNPRDNEREMALTQEACTQNLSAKGPFPDTHPLARRQGGLRSAPKALWVKPAGLQPQRGWLTPAAPFLSLCHQLQILLLLPTSLCQVCGSSLRQQWHDFRWHRRLILCWNWNPRSCTWVGALSLSSGG